MTENEENEAKEAELMLAMTWTSLAVEEICELQECPIWRISSRRRYRWVSMESIEAVNEYDVYKPV